MMPCGLHHILQSEYVRLWVKKKGGNDYSRMIFSGKPHRNDFILYEIPKPLVDAILPIIQQTTSFEVLLPVPDSQKKVQKVCQHHMFMHS